MAENNFIRRRRYRWLGPLLIIFAMLAMLSWTWLTWPDPLVDFGTQLYVPWRIVHGEVLYRDLAYYNGPLSSYLDAAVFKLFGVGMHRLEVFNGIILAGMMVVIYRLTLRASGRLSAIFAGLTIALVFAVGQSVSLGNYNWLTPYTTELTQGVAVGILAIAVLDRHLRSGRIGWAILGGLLCGTVFLTKAEPTAACAAAMFAQLLAWIWIKRPSWRAASITLGTLIGFTILVPILAMALLSLAMPWPAALQGTLGSWPWLFDPRVTALPFYRHISGLDNVSGNLLSIGQWTLGYIVVITLFFLTARAPKRLRIALLVIWLVALCIAFDFINWLNALLPLPIVLGIVVIGAGVAVFQRRPGPTALRLALVVYALALLGKLWLNTHAYHYGFALAMPAALVCVAVGADYLPTWVARWEGDKKVVRWLCFLPWLGFVGATLLVEHRQIESKMWTISSSTPDSIRVTTRGLEVAEAVKWIDKNVSPTGTVAVMPQGLMVNYLARRAAPIKFVNLMPPEVLAAGATAVVTALDRHPPSAIIIDRSATQAGEFSLDRQYQWGRPIISWIHQHYIPERNIVLPPPLPTLYGFEIWLPKPVKRDVQ